MGQRKDGADPTNRQPTLELWSEYCSPEVLNAGPPNHSVLAYRLLQEGYEFRGNDNDCICSEGGDGWRLSTLQLGMDLNLTSPTLPLKMRGCGI